MSAALDFRKCKHLLLSSLAVSPQGFTLQSNGTAFAVQNPRIDDIEKQVEQEVQLVSLLVEMRGFEPRSTRPSSALSTRLVGD